MKRDWIVRYITDRGAGAFYRYRVSGENLNHPIGHPDRRFTWDVPALCERYAIEDAIVVSADDRRHFLRHC